MRASARLYLYPATVVAKLRDEVMEVILPDILNRLKATIVTRVRLATTLVFFFGVHPRVPSVRVHRVWSKLLLLLPP